MVNRYILVPVHFKSKFNWWLLCIIFWKLFDTIIDFVNDYILTKSISAAKLFSSKLKNLHLINLWQFMYFHNL